MAAERALRANRNRKVAAAPRASSTTAGARTPTLDEVHERELEQRIARLEALASRYETVIDNIPQGVCFFDADERLILRNRRYCEIYHIAPERVLPGATLTEIMALRIAARTAPSAVDAFFAQARATRAQLRREPGPAGSPTGGPFKSASGRRQMAGG